MKPFIYMVLFSLVSLTFSCNTDDKDELTKDGSFQISELAGIWDAIKAQFSINSISVGLIEDGGTAEMSVQPNGRFSLTLDTIDGDAYTVNGKVFWEEWKQTFYFTIVGDDNPDDWDTYGHTSDGTTLSFNGDTNIGEYDFNNDGAIGACFGSFHIC